LRKYYFTNRALNTWNSLPNWVVMSDTVNTCKNKLDRFWHDQYTILKQKFKAQETEVGIRN